MVGVIEVVVFSLPWFTAKWVGRQMKAEFSPSPEFPNRHFNSSAVGGALLYECLWIFLGIFGGILGSIETRSIWVFGIGLLGLIPAGIQRSLDPY